MCVQKCLTILHLQKQVSQFTNRFPLRSYTSLNYEEVPYHGFKRMIPIPITRITTSPSRVYRTREVVSPVRMLTTTTRTYRRDVTSPARVITSPARIVTVRMRPSVLTREYGRIENKYRVSPVRFNATESYLNSPYALVKILRLIKSQNLILCFLVLCSMSFLKKSKIIMEIL